MSDSTKGRLVKIQKAFTYVGKIISTAALVLLVLLGMFLLYYLISAKLVSKNPNYEPKLALYTIVSGSMEPNINVYDVIIDVKVDKPTDIKIGDVITFTSTSSISKDYIVTHRVIDIKQEEGQYVYVTKGDNNPTADSDTAKYDKIIGKVKMRIPQLGRIQFFLATKLGWFIVVLLPAMGVVIYDVIKLLKLIGTKNKSEKIVETPVKDEPLTKEQIEQKQLEETLEKIKKNNYMQRLEELKRIDQENQNNKKD